MGEKPVSLLSPLKVVTSEKKNDMECQKLASKVFSCWKTFESLSCEKVQALGINIFKL